MNAILGPSHHLTQIVSSCGKAIISSRKIGQSPHLAPLPNEPEIDVADVVRRTVESRATPALPQRLGRESLGNTHDDSRSIFHIPRYTAIWSAECVEVD